MIHVTIIGWDHRVLHSFDADAGTTIAHVREIMVDWWRTHGKTHMSVHRQGYVLVTTPLTGERSGSLLKDNQKLVDLVSPQDGSNNVRLQFKDLGPQVSWQGVFVAEYVGPAAMYVFFWIIGGAATDERARLMQQNCGYYWLAGCAISLSVNRAAVDPPHSMGVMWFGFALMCVAELANGWAHHHLASLRTPGSRAYVIPSGPLFDVVVCPNYSAEILAWIGFSVATGAWAAWVFTVVGGVQMWAWAKVKRRRLVKLFPNQSKALAHKPLLFPLPYL